MMTMIERAWLWLIQRRRIVQATSALLFNSYVTQQVTKGLPCPAMNCYACPASAFACPIGTIQHFIGRRKFPLYTLGVIGLVGTLIGRASCGWFCPFGWFQELMYKLPVRKWPMPNRFNWTRYVILATLVVVIPWISHEPWFCKLCPVGSLEASIPLALLSADIRALIGGFYALKVSILAAFLIWMSKTQRPFCRWVCPLGALWSPFNPWSTFRLAVDESRCIQCERCFQVCPVEIHVYQEPNSGACIRCMRCVQACPVSCITVTSPGWSLESDRNVEQV